MRVLITLPGTGHSLMGPIRDTLQSQAEVWAGALRRNPLPLLYESGIRYQPEPWAGQGTEEWANPYDVYERGWGDCDDLVLYRVAELIAKGEPATVQTMWKRGTKRHHVRVRRANGRVEDPSLILLKLAKDTDNES